MNKHLTAGQRALLVDTLESRRRHMRRQLTAFRRQTSTTAGAAHRGV